VRLLTLGALPRRALDSFDNLPDSDHRDVLLHVLHLHHCEHFDQLGFNAELAMPSD
jgi:hypothetical protein